MKLVLSSRRSAPAFTMVEVALCIAIVAFAMVAIIGILPAGLQVQRDNREDTVISQDSLQVIEAVRGGTNSFVTNNFANLASSLVWLRVTNTAGGNAYYTNLSQGEIVGLLCTPHYDATTGALITNSVRARFMAGTGPLGDTGVTDPELRFGYIVTSEIEPFQYFYPDPNYQTNNANLMTNLHEFRMIVRWPVLGNDTLGNGRKVFRTLIGGNLTRNDVTNGVPYAYTNGLFYYFTGSTYVSAQ